MTTTINASLSAGLVQTADTSGNLSLQSGGTTILALTSAGAAVTGTLSASGQTTLTGGVNLTSVVGTSYVTGTLASTFTFDGSGGTTASKTLTYEKMGNWVKLNLPAITATTGTGSTEIASNTALDATVRPATTQYVVSAPMINAGATVAAAGRITIQSNGIVAIQLDGKATAYGNSATGGLNAATSILYFIG